MLATHILPSLRTNFVSTDKSSASRKLAEDIHESHGAHFFKSTFHAAIRTQHLSVAYILSDGNALAKGEPFVSIGAAARKTAVVSQRMVM